MDMKKLLQIVDQPTKKSVVDSTDMKKFISIISENSKLKLQREDTNTTKDSSKSNELSIQQLATISDEALDKAYGYGRSSPGNTFGWQANLMSAAYAKKMIDAGETDIERISDAIHKGWNVTAQKFVKNPDQFDDTEKLRQAGKLDSKLQQREKLMKIDYAQLSNDEQEKDRVVARALLKAIKDHQGVEESGLQYYTGKKKYGADGMKALSAAGRKGASQEELGRIKDRYIKKESTTEGLTFKDYVNLAEAKKKITAKEDPCWKGYKMVGTKKKGGREVPNCVPGKKGD